MSNSFVASKWNVKKINYRLIKMSRKSITKINTQINNFRKNISKRILVFEAKKIWNKNLIHWAMTHTDVKILFNITDNMGYVCLVVCSLIDKKNSNDAKCYVHAGQFTSFWLEATISIEYNHVEYPIHRYRERLHYVPRWHIAQCPPQPYLWLYIQSLWIC